MVVPFLTHFADLSSWEYAQKLIKVRPLQRVLIMISNPVKQWGGRSTDPTQETALGTHVTCHIPHIPSNL